MQGMTWDAVVIGSGLGGLTAAALLASRGRSVCVIERNHSVGGAASIFRSGALTIEPSLHQTADPRNPLDPRHEFMNQLGLLEDIEWLPVRPFFRTRGGPVGEAFDLPVGFEAAEQALAERYPRSRDGVRRTLGAMKALTRGVAHLSEARQQRSLRKLVGSAIELRSRAISRTSANPAVVSSPVFAPLRSISALVKSVVAWTTRPTCSGRTPALASASGGIWRWVVEAGWQARERVSPMLTTRFTSFSRS